jgi:hypothetical protein
MFFKDWVLSHLNVIEPCFHKRSKQDDNAHFKKLNPHVLIHEFSKKCNYLCLRLIICINSSYTYKVKL